MELEKMTIQELEERRSAIADEVEAEDADLDALENEVRSINAEIETRKAEETKKAEIRSQVASGAGEVIEKVEVKENKAMTEVRASKEYKEAYGAYVKADYNLDKVSEEERALLTVNATNGTIAVPTQVDETIRTAWENDEIMGRIKKTFFKGNLKVGFEKSATGAVNHVEGSGKVDPENLVISYVDLIPKMVKKVVEVSDEVLANNDAMVDYLYDELEYQIVRKAGGNVIDAIVGADAALVPVYSGAVAGSFATHDLIMAQALLTGDVANPVVIMSRADAARLKADVLNYTAAFDPFDGMQVVYNENLPEGTPFIIADLNAVQGNFPEGYEVKFKFDDATKADEDIVRIIARLYAAFAVTDPGRIVRASAE